MRYRGLWVTLIGILAIIVASLLFAAWPGGSTFTVDKETTYIVGPLDDHGSIDYVTAFNKRLSNGIKPEDNANVLIWMVLGPHPEGGTMPPEFFKWMGIESPPEQGEYLSSWGKVLKENAKLAEALKREATNDPLYQSTNWPWKAEDQPELADWLKQNEKPLAVTVEATRRPQYYNPLVPSQTNESSSGLISALLPAVQKCRQLANALVCRAMLRINEGKVDEAWQDILACHRLGRLVARGGCLIEMLVGIAIDQIADKGDVVFLNHAPLTSTQVLAYLKDLRRLPPMPAVADKVDLGERFLVLETILSMARYGAPVLESPEKAVYRPHANDQFKDRLFTRSTNWDPALRNANLWFDRYISALRIPDRATRVQETKALENELKILKQEVAETGILERATMGPSSRGEWIGNFLITLTMPALDKVQGAADRCEQVKRNVHFAFALAAYKKDNGHFPAKLDDLAPKYLPTIPNDLFSDKPLIYRLEDKGYLLYSVGPNGIDDGGHGEDDEPRGDDLPIHMPVAEPQIKKP